MADEARLVEAARGAVLDGAAVARLLQQSIADIRAITKDDESPVTVADFATQAAVIHSLSQRLGRRVHVVAEESSHFLRAEEHAAHLDAVIAAVREVWPGADIDEVLDTIDEGASDTAHPVFWALDPIDGTKGFLRGEQYCIALARVESGTPTIAALACPVLALDQSEPLDEPDSVGSLYLAVKGAGAWEARCDEERAELSRLLHSTPAENEPLRICHSIVATHSDETLTSRVLRRLEPLGEPVRLDSQCKYAVVARGQADGYLRVPARRGYIERIWDHAAGSLVAAEAGCLVTDLEGRLLDFSTGRGLERNRGIVAAPPRAHGRIMAAIEAERA